MTKDERINRAISYAKKSMVEHVYNIIRLEGINFTFAETQTILEGVSVGGKSIQEVQITLNQKHALQFLFDAVKYKTFSLSKAFVCELHNYATYQEALKWGIFRDSNVRISGTSYVPPAFYELDHLWQEDIAKPHQQFLAGDKANLYSHAIYIFATMAKHQFFFDGNKRMGRYIMNGILLSEGYPSIDVPYIKKEAFITLLLDFYSHNDITALQTFMKDCLNQYDVEGIGYNLTELKNM